MARFHNYRRNKRASKPASRSLRFNVYKTSEEVENQLKQLGASTQFNDTTYQTFYDYYRLSPSTGRLNHAALFEVEQLNYNHNYNNNDNDKPRTKKKVQSLKSICADVLAQNADSITKEHFKATGFNWNVWSAIWNSILFYEKDTPSTFYKFCSGFANNPSFNTHYITASRNPTFHNLKQRKQHLLRNRNRDAYIAVNSITRKHRFETFYSNLNFTKGIVSDLNSFHKFSSQDGNVGIGIAPELDTHFESLSILNLSGLKIGSVAHAISNIKNLVYLNVSNCDLAENLVKSWCMGMKAGKMPKLTCLIINDNPNLKNLNDLYDVRLKSLAYIESTLHDTSCRTGLWDQIQDASVLNQTDSLKLKMLIDNGLVDVPFSIYQSVIIDYRVLNKSLDDLNNHDGDYLWKIRFLNVKNHAIIRAFVKNRKREQALLSESNLSKSLHHGSSTLPRNKTVSSSRIAKIKPKTKKFNMKKFLDM
ncbi:unnamed protein product [Ambrosiozyma monospora]|uniref:Unnamed protein product n=1 Tax=Ambrosiozyma monospora TaxID=43982 RepID=A0ACB5SVP4_AMBMO|nr:unnamed protein product [Ambrosiozyma monospora]